MFRLSWRQGISNMSRRLSQYDFNNFGERLQLIASGAEYIKQYADHMAEATSTPEEDWHLVGFIDWVDSILSYKYYTYEFFMKAIETMKRTYGLKLPGPDELGDALGEKAQKPKDKDQDARMKKLRDLLENLHLQPEAAERLRIKAAAAEEYVRVHSNISPTQAFYNWVIDEHPELDLEGRHILYIVKFLQERGITIQFANLLADMQEDAAIESPAAHQIDHTTLQDKLDRAIKEERYEDADQIKKEIEDLRQTLSSQQIFLLKKAIYVPKDLKEDLLQAVHKSSDPSAAFDQWIEAKLPRQYRQLNYLAELTDYLVRFGIQVALPEKYVNVDEIPLRFEFMHSMMGKAAPEGEHFPLGKGLKHSLIDPDTPGAIQKNLLLNFLAMLTPTQKRLKQELLKDPKLKALEQELREAIKNENYEKAEEIKNKLKQNVDGIEESK